MYKESQHLVSKFGFIAPENLNIAGMVRNHHLAESIQDAAWNKFVRYMPYKAAIMNLV